MTDAYQAGEMVGRMIIPFLAFVGGILLIRYLFKKPKKEEVQVESKPNKVNSN